MSVQMFPSRNAVRITVMKKLHHRDLIEQYTDSGDWPACNRFEIGQEFVVGPSAPWEPPEDFCGWAWSDMQKMVCFMARGGPNVFVTCCTDGYRPVVFKLEKVAHDT